GVWIDRHDRSLALRLSSAYMVVISALFALFLGVAEPSAWHLFAFMLASGVGWAANSPTRRAVYGDAVPKNSLLNALSLDATAFETVRLASPAAAGLAISAWGVEAVFWVQSTVYLVALAFAMGVRVAPHDFLTVRKISYLRNLREGMAYAVRNRTVLVLVLLSFALTFVGQPFLYFLLPVFAAEHLGLGPEAIGGLLSGAALGGTLGPIALASAGDIRRKHLVLAAALVVLGLGIAGFSLASVLWVAIAAYAVVGFADVMQRTLSQTILQSSIDSAHRGRVTSVATMVTGLGVVSGFVAGVGAELLGVATMIFVGGFATIAVAVAAGVALRGREGLEQSALAQA
ncbi:MAG: MFS transporter, partial [Chloroflexi bacterium]|nr:MFS transporter [Chloroflexota bacterium]